MNENIILKIENLSVSYKDNKIIDNVNIEIKKGKVYSLYMAQL